MAVSLQTHRLASIQTTHDVADLCAIVFGLVRNPHNTIVFFLVVGLVLAVGLVDGPCRNFDLQRCFGLILRGGCGLLLNSINRLVRDCCCWRGLLVLGCSLYICNRLGFFTGSVHRKKLFGCLILIKRVKSFLLSCKSEFYQHSNYRFNLNYH